MGTANLDELQRWRAACRDGCRLAIVALIAPAIHAELPHLLARYLNEYGEPAPGRWMAFGSPAVQALSLGAAEKALLGVEHDCPLCPAGSACVQKKVSKAIAGLGCAILTGELAWKATRELSNVFRISIGIPLENPKDAHLAIQPRESAAHHLPALAGDAFLEWAAVRETAQPL